MLVPRNEVSNVIRPSDPGPSFLADRSVSIDQLLAMARRQTRSLVLGVVVGLVLGGAFLAVAPKQYTGTVDILLDSKKAKGLTGTDGNLADLSLDTSAVDSQVELLKSRQILETVIREQNVKADQPTFLVGVFLGLKDQISAGVDGLLTALGLNDKDALTEAQRRQFELDAIVGYMSDRLDIKRTGRTYVLRLTFNSTSATKSANVANALARAYLDDQFNANFEVSRRASEWLQTRVQEVKAKSLEADLAVQRFRSQKGLIATSQNGTLVSDQQLTEVNRQLIDSRAATSQSKAKLERIQTIISTGQADAAVAEAINSQVIVGLRNKYTQAAKTVSDLEKRLGKDHVQVVRLYADMREYERLIFEELGRIAESYKSEYDIAMARQKTLEAELAKQVSASGVINEDLVHLSELERESETYKSLLQTLLMRYQETIQKQTFPVSEARVISAATAPLDPSAPKKLIVLALALIGGGVLGAIRGGLREYRDRGFRTSSQLRDTLGLKFLGMLPRIVQKPHQDLIGSAASNAKGGLPRNTLMRYAVDNPLSGFAETLRSAKVSMDIALGDTSPKVIGVTSVLPFEGKTAVSKNLASLVAHLGARTILIDGDMRNPGLTRAVGGFAPGGLLEVLTNAKPWTECILNEPESGLSILPAPIDRGIANTAELLSSAAMRRLLKELGARYDYIFIDLPPIGPTVDARAAEHLLNGFVFVVEWGKTSKTVVRDTLAEEPGIFHKCVGVIMNKVDISEIGLFEDYVSKEYYYDEYTTAQKNAS